MAASSGMVDKILVAVAVVAIGVAIYVMVKPTGKTPQGNGNNSPTAPTEAPVVPVDETPASSEDLAALRAHFAEMATKKEESANFVEVQHILIGFKNDQGGETVPGKGVTRTQQEAESLVAELFRRAKAGEDFGAMVAKYTNDSPPGIYGMWSNRSDVPAGKPSQFHRGGMVGAFGDTGWRLKVGEVGVSNFDPVKSPYGYHIIKRLK